jgi:competence ComEA-like helix-hairpin-helix protein
MKSNKGGKQPLSPASWLAYGVLCGFAAAGLVVFLMGRPRGAAIELLPAPTRALLQFPVTSATRTAEPSMAPLSIDINTAGLQDLQKLPNIGPVIAQAIIDYRQSHDGFAALEELQNVTGIGPKTYEAIQPYIRLGEP